VAANLISAFLTGLKWAITRAWSESQEALLRRTFAQKKLVRLQSNWANDTIFGWGMIAHISDTGPANEVVTRRTVIEAGCGETTTEAYCNTYLEGCKSVFTIYFMALWTVEGVPIRRHPSMPNPLCY
jgi:hypothetical protein